MLTDTQADKSYEKALDALDLLIDDEGISAKERAAAERKRRRLTLDYIGQAIERIEARTAKFQAFIAEMQEIIDKFDPATTVAGILKLKGVVEEAGKLVESASGAVAAMPKGRAAAPRATRGAVKSGAVKRTATKRPAPSAGKPAGGGTAKRTKAALGTAAKTKRPAAKRRAAASPAVKGPAVKRAAAKRPAAKRRPAAPTRAGKPRAARP